MVFQFLKLRIFEQAHKIYNHENYELPPNC